MEFHAKLEETKFLLGHEETGGALEAVRKLTGGEEQKIFPGGRGRDGFYLDLEKRGFKIVNFPLMTIGWGQELRSNR